MSQIVLRDYQERCIEKLRDGIRAGHRKQILCAPTGSGKTEMAAFLTQETERKGNRVAWVLDRIVLCDQTSKRFDAYGLEHGVLQSGHWRYRPNHLIQVCSAQTLEKRGFPGNLKLLFVDEAHCQRKQTSDIIRSTDAIVIGLTATPFSKGLGQLYSNVVNIVTTDELVEQGYLVPLKVYAAKAIDMRGAKLKFTGEWDESEIEKRGTEIIGDIVTEWQDKTSKHFGGPVKTICFSATVAHGEAICKQFQAAGFNFHQISYQDGGEESRRELMREFAKPDSTVHGLVSCEVLTKGFDCPDVMCGIAARPYRKSLSSHIQQLGRVMRPAPGKAFALWLDHCSNYLRFMRDTTDIFANGVRSLKDGEHDAKVRKEPEEGTKAALVCSCGFVLQAYMERCPACGKERLRRNTVETLAGEMVEINGTPDAKLPECLRDRASVWRQLCLYSMERKRDETLAKKKALAIYRSFYNSWPVAPFRADYNEPLDARVHRRIKHQNIRWAKGHQKREAAA